MRKIKAAEVDPVGAAIREMEEYGSSQMEAARHFKVSQSSISKRLKCMRENDKSIKGRFERSQTSGSKVEGREKCMMTTSSAHKTESYCARTE